MKWHKNKSSSKLFIFLFCRPFSHLDVAYFFFSSVFCEWTDSHWGQHKCWIEPTSKDLWYQNFSFTSVSVRRTRACVTHTFYSGPYIYEECSVLTYIIHNETKLLSLPWLLLSNVMLLLWFVTREYKMWHFFSNMTIDQMYFHFGLWARNHTKQQSVYIYIAQHQQWTIATRRRWKKKKIRSKNDFFRNTNNEYVANCTEMKFAWRNEKHLFSYHIYYTRSVVIYYEVWRLCHSVLNCQTMRK